MKTLQQVLTEHPVAMRVTHDHVYTVYTACGRYVYAALQHGGLSVGIVREVNL